MNWDPEDILLWRDWQSSRGTLEILAEVGFHIHDILELIDYTYSLKKCWHFKEEAFMSKADKNWAHTRHTNCYRQPPTSSSINRTCWLIRFCVSITNYLFKSNIGASVFVLITASSFLLKWLSHANQTLTEESVIIRKKLLNNIVSLHVTLA